MAASMSASALLSHERKSVPSSLRIGTVNIGQALTRKLPHIVQWASLLDLHVVALQECGDHIVDKQWLGQCGYCISLCGRDHAGVAILYKQSLAPLVTTFLQVSKEARSD